MTTLEKSSNKIKSNKGNNLRFSKSGVI